MAAVVKRDLTHSDDPLCGLIRPPRPREDGRRISVWGWQADAEGDGPIGLDIAPEVISGGLSCDPIAAFRDRVLGEREVGAVGPTPAATRDSIYPRVLAVCMAIISLSDNAVFQIAACWILPLAYPVVPLYKKVHQGRSIARAPGGERSSSRSDSGAINK